MIKVKQLVYTIIHPLSNKFEHLVTLVVRGIRIYWHIFNFTIACCCGKSFIWIEFLSYSNDFLKFCIWKVTWFSYVVFFKQLFEKWVVIKIKIKKRKKIYKDKGDAREKQNKTKQNKNKQIEMWEKIDSYKDKGNCERK